MSTDQLEVLSPSRVSFAPTRPSSARPSFGRWLAERLVGGALALSPAARGSAWEEWRQRW